MAQKIIITAGELTLDGELNNSPTAQAIAALLPLQGTVLTWGEEIYFAIPLVAELDDTAVDLVEPGDLGYWPPGRALCLFFGPTPISGPGEIRPTSPVNRVGRMFGEINRLQQVPAGIIIKVDKAG
ncbi:MAG: cyclophilin-like fold protein [Desulfobacteraceae bacterium]